MQAGGPDVEGAQLVERRLQEPALELDSELILAVEAEDDAAVDAGDGLVSEVPAHGSGHGRIRVAAQDVRHGDVREVHDVVVALPAHGAGQPIRAELRAEQRPLFMEPGPFVLQVDVGSVAFVAQAQAGPGAQQRELGCVEVLVEEGALARVPDAFESEEMLAQVFGL